jgi:serine/threonine-protein kinase RIM15
MSRRVMEVMITKLGCRVVTCADGAEAVRCAMGEVKFDIIFTDLRLPKSTSFKYFLIIVQGDNVARMIRGTENINNNTPIVAVTSYALHGIDTKLFDAVIEKPVSPGQLSTEIESLCYWKPPISARRTSVRMQRIPSTSQQGPSTV